MEQLMWVRKMVEGVMLDRSTEALTVGLRTGALTAGHWWTVEC